MNKQKVWAEIKRQFPGKSNRALRERIFKLAENSGQVLGLEKTIALTDQGKMGLHHVQGAIDGGHRCRDA